MKASTTCQISKLHWKGSETYEDKNWHSNRKKLFLLYFYFIQEKDVLHKKYESQPKCVYKQ